MNAKQQKQLAEAIKTNNERKNFKFGSKLVINYLVDNVVFDNEYFNENIDDDTICCVVDKWINEIIDTTDVKLKNISLSFSMAY